MASKRVGSAHIEFSARTAKVISGMDAAKKATKQATQQMKKDVAEAKQSLALLGEEAGIHLPRQIRGFVTALPGVASAMSAAFSAVAIIGLGKIVYDVGKKVYDFAQEGKQAASTISAAWAEITNTTRTAGVGLDVANDKLEVTIARLEHKPANLLKLALDEDRKAAYELANEIGKAAKASDDLMAKAGVSKFKQVGLMLLNHNLLSTADQQKTISDVNADLERAAKAARDAEDKAKPGKDAEAVKLSNRTALTNAYVGAIKKVESALQDVYTTQRQTKYDSPLFKPDYSAQTSMLEGSLDDLKSRQHNLLATYRQGDDEIRVEQDEQKKAMAEAAKQAAEKQFQAQMKAMEQQLAGLKIDHHVTVAEEYDFWLKMLSTAKAGSLAWQAVREKLGTAAQGMDNWIEEQLKKYDEANKKKLAAEKKFAAQSIETFREILNAEGEEADSAYQLSAIYAKNAAELKELNIQHKVATGEITRQDAAMQMAALHAATYGAEMDRLKAKLASTEANGLLKPDEKAKQLASINAQIAALQGTVDKQHEIDQWEVAQLDAFGGIRQAMDELIVRSRDVSGQMREAFTTALSGVNDSLVSLMTGKGTKGAKQDLSKMFSGLANQGAHSAIASVEGSLFSKLGARNADGKSEASALWVKMVGGVKGIGSEVKNGLSDLIPSSSSQGSGSGGFMSRIFGSLTSMLVPHAAGGPVSAGTAYMVGEHGPEPFFPNVSGTMATNAAMRSAMGSGGSGGNAYYNVTVANGVTPEQMNMHMKAALNAAHPQMVASAMSAQQQHQLRKPLSKR